MSKKKKHKKSESKKQLPTEKILFAIAVLELARVILEIILKVLE